MFLRSAAAARKPKPGILLITADNLGYGDLGCYGNREIRSPNLDGLARQGVRFTNFYTGSPTCTASRASLLTGRHPLRYGLNYQLNAKENMSGVGLTHAERILPQYMKDLGYATGCFGKWNLGWAPGSRPVERGFDEFFGHRSGNMNYFTHTYNGVHDLYRGNQPDRAPGYAPDLFASAAIDFIGRNRANPWFVYLPFNSPHYPNKLDVAPGEPLEWQVPPRYLEQYGYSGAEKDEKRRYRAVVTALDDVIGRVLRAAGENTLVIFYSDNGAFMLPGRGLDVQSNKPLRDGGVTCWEGGIRVAGMIRWPNVVKPGWTCGELLSAFDLLPLCVSAGGGRVRAPKPLDGIDPSVVLRGGKSRHEALFFEYQKHQAVRRGKWKLVRTDSSSPWQLYDLARDQGETQDVASGNTAVAADLSARFTAWRSTILRSSAA
jgi:arylsulfatase A-like enzyme